MTSLKLNELIKERFHELQVPAGTENMTTLEAALAWARNGFFVLPILPKSKNPGSVVGRLWPEKSSRDEKQIHDWFEKGDYGLAIHVGKSGVFVFDIDDDSKLPPKLKKLLIDSKAPFQSTRSDNKLRGHHIFATKIGSIYGNSAGGWGKEWGEVRGANGVIVVAPSIHAKSEEGGRYKWERTGAVPILAGEIEARLRTKRGISVEKVDIESVRDFVEQHSSALFPELLDERLEAAKGKARIGSRHDTVRDLLMECLKEARAGLHSAEDVVSRVADFFEAIKPEQEPNEFVRMLQWVVAQVCDTPQDEIDAIRYQMEVLNSEGFKQWIKKYEGFRPESSNRLADSVTEFPQGDAQELNSLKSMLTFEEQLESNPALRKEFERQVIQHEAKEALKAILKERENSEVSDLRLASLKDEEFMERVGQIDWVKLWADMSIERWYVPGFICESRAHGIYAASGLGKSLLVLDMAAALATGKSALGHPAQEPIRVLYVDNENTPLGDIRPRLQQMGYEASELANLVYLSFPEIAPLNTDEGGRSFATILDKFQPQLVVLDTFSRFVEGDENLSSTTLEFYNKVGRLLKNRGIAYIRIDHVGKNSERGARGSSAKIDDLDIIWSLERGETGSEFVLENRKSRALIKDKKLLVERHQDPLRHTIKSLVSPDWKALTEIVRKFNLAIELISDLHKLYPDHSLAEGKTWKDLQPRCKSEGITKRTLLEALDAYRNPDKGYDSSSEWDEM